MSSKSNSISIDIIPSEGAIEGRRVGTPGGSVAMVGTTVGTTGGSVGATVGTTGGSIAMVGATVGKTDGTADGLSVATVGAPDGAGVAAIGHNSPFALPRSRFVKMQ
jgi:hypothetical protein